jgi:hypothetical protein
MSMRDLTQAIIPSLSRAENKPVIAVDDLTSLTPTQMAFWLAIFDHAQVHRLRVREKGPCTQAVVENEGDRR